MGRLEQFGENSFDVVSCFHVLEHVPRPMETLHALSKIARKYVLFAVPNLSAFNDLISFGIDGLNKSTRGIFNHGIIRILRIWRRGSASLRLSSGSMML